MKTFSFFFYLSNSEHNNSIVLMAIFGANIISLFKLFLFGVGGNMDQVLWVSEAENVLILWK